MPDWLFWALIPVLLILVGVFFYVRNKRPDDE